MLLCYCYKNALDLAYSQAKVNAQLCNDWKPSLKTDYFILKHGDALGCLLIGGQTFEYNFEACNRERSAGTSLFNGSNS